MKEARLCNYICIKFYKIKQSIVTERKSMIGEREVWLKGVISEMCKKNFGIDAYVHCFDCSGSFMVCVCVCVKIYSILYFKYVLLYANCNSIKKAK